MKTDKFKTGITKTKEIKFAWFPKKISIKTHHNGTNTPKIEEKWVWLESYKEKKKFYPNTNNFSTTLWNYY